jgi:outer membrane biosynthesis protein TonB
VTGASSLPPLKKNDGKLGLIALLLLLAAGALWFFMRGDDPEPEAEVEQPPAQAPVREQFAADIEIPDDEEETEAPDATRRPSGDEPSDKPGAGTRPEDWACNGSINTAQVSAVIRGAPSKQVQTCYERGLKGNNLLQGSMEVELTIGGSGTVRAVSVGGTLRDRQVHACVRRVARTWKFPKPTGGCVRINVPFQMTPKL